MTNKNKQDSISCEFKDNSAVINLFGQQNKNLHIIEKMYNVSINNRGSKINIIGEKQSIYTTSLILKNLYEISKKGEEIDEEKINDAISLLSFNGNSFVEKEDLIIETKRKKIFARSENQKKYFIALSKKDIIFAIGPAGTGKTYVAVAKAVSYLKKRIVERIILSRPAVEAGEKIGFLPGDMKEKVDPYLRPIYDALYDMMPYDLVDKKIMSGEIEIAPIAFMRGRTLNNSFIILDEAQNTSIIQMKMLLTRLGRNSKMVIAGDVTQIDLPKNIESGLTNASKKLSEIDDIAFINLTKNVVVRHKVVQKIIEAYLE